MNFEETNFKDVYIIHKTPFIDERGSFTRTFCANEFQEQKIINNMVQTNLSISNKKHTLRGMHMQLNEAAEDKLIQCIQGTILDVIIDLRKESETYGKYFSIELSESNNKMLLVPKGFAHGFLTLQHNTIVLYQVSNYYTSAAEKGYRWDDPFFSINWPCKNPILSEKDKSWENYKG